MAQPIRRDKIPRNSPCPCGSGKKFKKCHGQLGPGRNPYPYAIPPEVLQKLAEHQGAEARRRRQQGLGRPIVSFEFGGHRHVAVGGTLHSSPKWKTFHDFLLYYINHIFGAEWGNAELAKPSERQHPLIKWYQLVCEQQRLMIKTLGEVATGHQTGAVTAYLNLAYCLYLLNHNLTLQERLLKRLRNADQFPGALYETMVAASFLKARFELTLEDEDDRSSTHCEFNATYPDTGQTFSVEAKARTSFGTPQRPRTGRHLTDALGKKTPHQRIVFIDLAPPVEKMEIGGAIWRDSVTRPVRKLERDRKGSELPSAYVFLTYDSAVENLTTTEYVRSVILDGFKMDHLRLYDRHHSLREALQWRKDHAAMLALMKSMDEHGRVPPGFNGEIPSFDPANDEDRLVIGRTYRMPQEGGEDRIAKLTTAIVMEETKKAACAFQYLDDSSNAVHMVPLTDEDLAVYRMDPDTFFGVVHPPGKKTTDPLELFDFFYDGYSKTPTPRLLELLASHPRHEELASADREEIVTTLCESYVFATLADAAQKPKPGTDQT